MCAAASAAHPASPLGRKLGVEVDSLQVENPDVIRDMMRTISVAHVARTWQQKARRRLRINKNDVSQVGGWVGFGRGCPEINRRFRKARRDAALVARVIDSELSIWLGGTWPSAQRV